MPGHADFPYRMRDLVRLTGVSAPAIHFYAQQGLLPESAKTAGNQAVYSAATVDRIRWIRRVQTDLHLPLRTIGWIIDRHGELPPAEISALQAVGRLLDEPDPVAPAEELARVRARLDAEDIPKLVDAGLISPTADSVSVADLRLLEAVASLRDAGFTTAAGFDAEGFAVYRDAIDGLIAEEVRRFVEPLLEREPTEAINDRIRRGLPLANRLLTELHQRAVQREVQRWLEHDDGAGHGHKTA